MSLVVHSIHHLCPASRFVTVPTSGLSIAFGEFGDPAGIPVLLMHGLGADMTIFPESELIAPMVALGCRIVRIDHRDCGQSEHLLSAKPVGVISTALKHKLGISPRVPYTLDDTARDAAELLAELGIDRAHAVGHSIKRRTASCTPRHSIWLYFGKNRDSPGGFSSPWQHARLRRFRRPTPHQVAALAPPA